jgi:hypothetical protein
MNDDIPKLPNHQVEYVIERSFVNHSPLPEKEGNPFHEPAKHAENFGGQFVTASGTAYSLASPSAPPDEYVYCIPESRPLPEVEIQIQHAGKNMELITNPR